MSVDPKGSLYAEGVWAQAAGPKIDVFDPTDGSVIASIPSGDAGDVATALGAARSAQRRVNSRFSPPAATQRLPKRGPRSMPWRPNSTNSAMPPAPAPHSR